MIFERGGEPVAATTLDEEARASSPRSATRARLCGHASRGRGVRQLEAVTPEGCVFVVRDGERAIVAVDRARLRSPGSSTRPAAAARQSLRARDGGRRRMRLRSARPARSARASRSASLWRRAARREHVDVHFDDGSTLRLDARARGTTTCWTTPTRLLGRLHDDRGAPRRAPRARATSRATSSCARGGARATTSTSTASRPGPSCSRRSARGSPTLVAEHEPDADAARRARAGRRRARRRRLARVAASRS